jgi:predicted MFS family arabinose efflux permease
MSKLTRRALFALAILFCINLLNFFDRQLFGALAEPIRKEFQINDAALGLLGTAFTLLYAVVGLPLGYLSDRWSRTRLIAIGTALWSILTATSGIAQSYVQLFLSRLGVGMGEAVCAPAGQSLLGDLFPPRYRARAMSVFMLGIPVGIFLAYGVGGSLGSSLGWRAVFLLAGIPGIALAALALSLREPVRGAADAVVLPVDVTRRASALDVLKIPTMWWIILSGVFHNFNMYALNSFQTPFLQRFHEMSLRDANNIAAISAGAVGVIGMLGGGWLADKVGARYRSRRMLVAACSMALAVPCIFVALSQPKGATLPFMAFMSLGTMAMYVYYPTVYSAIQDVIAPHLRGTAVAIYFCAMYVLGASLGPVGTGILSDYFARQAMFAAGATTMNESFKAAGLHTAMYAIPLLAGLASIVLFAGTVSMRRNAASSPALAGDSGVRDGQPVP